jgi:hypothetical protein
MTRRSGAAALCALFILASPSVAQATKLTKTEAKVFTARAMIVEYGDAWLHGDGHLIRCRDRITRKAIRCRVSWGVGDVGWKGWVKIKQTGETRLRTRFRWDGRLLFTNYYCLHETPETDCTRVEYVHGTERM